MVRHRRLPLASPDRGIYFSWGPLGWIYPRIAQLQKFGLNRFLGVAGAGAGCGVTGLVTGMLEAGLMPGVGGWVSTGWGWAFTIAMGSASIGAVAAVGMSRSASHQSALDKGDDVEATPGSGEATLKSTGR
jgi:hypothetical protein